MLSRVGKIAITFTYFNIFKGISSQEFTNAISSSELELEQYQNNNYGNPYAQYSNSGRDYDSLLETTTDYYCEIAEENSGPFVTSQAFTALFLKHYENYLEGSGVDICKEIFPSGVDGSGVSSFTDEEFLDEQYKDGSQTNFQDQDP